MNITKQRLNQIIQEEYERLLDEIAVNEETLEEWDEDAIDKARPDAPRSERSHGYNNPITGERGKLAARLTTSPVRGGKESQRNAAPKPVDVNTSKWDSDSSMTQRATRQK